MSLRIFITGITGTLGTALAELHHKQGDQVFGCARNESKVVEWLGKRPTVATVFVGDARLLAYIDTDIGRLLPSMDRVYHCAAMKHVDLCEQQPVEAIAQNVGLTKTVAFACKKIGTQMIHVSSDKACLPQGVYGATKLLAERIALLEGAAVVRLGNLVGSSGSVFALWKRAAERGEPLRVTDRGMTRYFIGVEEAVRFISSEAVPEKVVIPARMKAVQMGVIADALARGFWPQLATGSKCSSTVVEIGERYGETKHQWLVAPGENYEQRSNKLVIDFSKNFCPNMLGESSATAERWKLADLLELIKRSAQ